MNTVDVTDIEGRLMAWAGHVLRVGDGGDAEAAAKLSDDLRAAAAAIRHTKWVAGHLAFYLGQLDPDRSARFWMNHAIEQATAALAAQAKEATP